MLNGRSVTERARANEGPPNDGPVVVDDAVYVAGGSQLPGFNLPFGESLWVGEIELNVRENRPGIRP